jgi:hypothetical protein
MAFADLFSGVATRLFGAPAPPDADQALIAEAIEAIVEAVDPRIRAERKYRAKLEPGVRATLAHMRAIAQQLPEPVMLSPASWRSEPLINALFGRSGDVTALLGRSRELYRFFDANVGCAEATALLAAQREERTVLAPGFVGGELRQDVAQVTVGFPQKRLIAPAPDWLASRREVGAAIFRRLAALALQEIVGKERRVKDLEERKANDPAVEIAELEKALQGTVDAFIAEKASLVTLEGTVASVRRVFEAPQKYLGLEPVALRLSRTGYRVDAGSSEPAIELKLQELFVGEGLRGVIAFVRCARSDLPPRDDALRRAEQSLR